MGVAELLEERQQLFLFQPLLELLRHFDSPWCFVLPDHDFDVVSHYFAELFTDCFRHSCEMLWIPVSDEGTFVGNAIEGDVDGDLSLRAEFLLHVEWKKDECPTAIARLYLRFELVLFHERSACATL